MPNYHVTEDGKVFRENGVELTQWKSNTGYMKVRFYGKKNRDMYVHRLVAEKYVPNPNNLPIVKHKDDNKLNNHASNLEWGTHSENAKEGYGNGCYKFHKRSYAVKATHKVTKEVIVAKSIRELSNILGHNRKTISSILKGVKEHNNFEYEFEYI